MFRALNEPTDEELDAVIEQIEEAEDIEVLTDPSSLEQMAEDLGLIYGDN
jgi:hypothetical protein